MFDLYEFGVVLLTVFVKIDLHENEFEFFLLGFLLFTFGTEELLLLFVLKVVLFGLVLSVSFCSK